MRTYCELFRAFSSKTPNAVFFFLLNILKRRVHFWFLYEFARPVVGAKSTGLEIVPKTDRVCYLAHLSSAPAEYPTFVFGPPCTRRCYRKTTTAVKQLTPVYRAFSSCLSPPDVYNDASLKGRETRVKTRFPLAPYS